jgi:protein-S-isoprenylcysteine O-methyltransferase Ste14
MSKSGGRMSESWQSSLERWSAAGLVDPATAARIREFEGSQEQPTHLRWPILIAIAFGALMLAAGVLLFVSAHWDNLSPSARFCLVLILVAIFHIAGAMFSERFPALSTAMHGAGTAVLGAGIFLSAQIFNLQEHWPGGVMLWALGAWIGWGLRRDWVQTAFVALLTPAWLASEWIEATKYMKGAEPILAQGLLLLALTYLSALSVSRRGTVDRVMAWIGGIAVIPCAIMAVPAASWSYYGDKIPGGLLILGKGLGVFLPFY